MSVRPCHLIALRRIQTGQETRKLIERMPGNCNVIKFKSVYERMDTRRLGFLESQSADLMITGTKMCRGCAL